MADNPYMTLADQDLASAPSKPASTPAAENPYMDLANEDLQRSQQQIRNMLDIVSPIDPDQAAEAVKLSRSSGLPEQTVQDNLAEVKRRERVRLLDLQRLTADSPVLARQLMDPSFAKLSQDNTSNMSEIEMAASYVFRSIGSGILNTTAAATKFVETVNPFTTSEQELAVLFKNDPAKLKDMRENGASAALSRWAQDQQKLANSIMANAPDEVKQKYGNLKYFTTDTDEAAYLSPVKIIGDVAQSLPTTLALMVSMYLTNGAAGNTYASMIEAGASREIAAKEAARVAAEAMAKYSAVSEGAVGYAQQANQTRAEADKITDAQLKSNPKYYELIDREGFSPEAARIYLSAQASEQAGTMAGVIDAVTNFYGGRFLGRYIAEGGALAPRVGKGFVTEALTEAPQSMGEQLAGNLAIQDNLNRDQSLSEGVAEAGAAGFVIGGVTGGAFSGLMGRVQDDQEQVSKANDMFGLLNRLNDLAGADVVRQRDVETFATFMQAVQDEHGGDVANLYIAPQTLIDTLTAAGANIQQVMASVPALANLQEQAQNGTDIAIPVADFATHIAGSEYAQALLPHLKTDPTGMSKVEADEYMKNNGEKLKAEIDAVLTQQDAKAEYKASIDKVKADIKAQLDETKRFTSEVNEAYATLMSTFFASMGAKIGMSPEEMAAKYKLGVAATGVAGAMEYDQAGQLKTETPNFKNWFKSSAIVDKDGKAKVMYHGTAQDIHQFRAKQAGAIFVTDNAKFADDFTEMSKDWMVEHHEEILTAKQLSAAKDAAERYIREEFANDPDKADLLAHEMRVGDRLTNIKARSLFNKAIAEQMPSGPNIMPVYVSAQNPFDYENPAHVAAVVAELNKSSNQWGEPRGDKAKGFIERGNWEEIEKDVTQKAIKAAGFDGFYVNEGKEKNLAVYNPTQIKSVFNNGEFDPSNPNILKQEGDAKPVFDQTETEAFKKWSNDAPLVTSADADTYEFKTGEKVALESYHGTKRPDRVGVKFLKKRATSGPMAFFTSSPELASTYASNKSDTSMVSEEYADYANWFKVKFKGERSATDIVRAWHRLTQDQKTTIAETAPKISLDPEGSGSIVLDEENTGGNGSYDYSLSQTRTSYDRRGNPLKAMVEDWLSSGNLFNDEGRFMEVLKLSGFPMENVEFDDPHAEYPFVYKTYIEMQNPIVSGDVPQDVIDALKAAAKKDRSRAKDVGADMWDKNTRTLREWVGHFTDENNKDAAYVWTSIPDKVTDVFRSMGYDGIIDYSGKGGGHMHPVYIPFEENQVKSAIGNKGTFDSTNNILKQGEGEARGKIAFGNDITQAQSVITLMKSANLSTFLHESGHFFLEVNADIAAQPDAPVEVVQDMQKILDWFGVENIQTWREMDIEQKRPYHEKFARGFEAYLFEGNAPSIELQGLFQRFRSWLVNIYKQLTELNVEMDDEIRGVFDRMLASSEAIRDAEQARSFAPLFTSKPPFMSDEEWLAYQQTDVQSAQDAVSELETKSLKDMKWLTNAKARILKQMQKDAAEQRKEVRREVAGEVMAEPVYRAREFFKRGTLDGEAVETPVKLSIDALEATYGEQKGERVKKQKQTNGFMDFLVKFGINISDRADVGGDAKGKYRVGLFVNKGTSLDVLAQNAVEYGYLTQADIDNESDNGGVNKLTEMIQRALSGERVLTIEQQVQENINRYDEEADPDADIPDIGAQSNVGTKQAMRDLGFSETEINEILANQFWKKLGFGKYGMLANGENTITPDQAAELFGFTSGDHLVRSLAEAPDPRSVIESRTDQRMLERYGDINSPQAMSRAADEAIHNDARARFVATEANALAKAVGKPRLVAQAAKQYAEQIINRLKIRNIRAGQYAASAARAGREAAKSKDLIEQATAKRNQLINTYAAKAAYAAQSEVISGVRYLTKFDGKNIAKTVHIDSLEQIWALLDRFDLRSSTSLKNIDRKKSLLQWMEAQRAKGNEPAVPQELLDEAYRTSYKELTLEDFRGLVDAVRNIEHLGRLKSKLIKIQDQREFKAVSGEAGEVIRENATGHIEQELEQKGIKNAIAANGREIFAWHRKFASLIRQMDGFKDGGYLWSTFVKPMNDAGTQEASMREGATVKLGELYKLLGKVKMDKKEFIPAIGASLSLEGRLAIALNMGNETNMRRVLEGENWTPLQVNAIVGTLTREQWTFVQGVLDLINSYWPEISAKERRLSGIVPEKVEARSFVVNLPDGTQMTMAGGYYPIKYNAARSSKSAADAAADVLKQMERGLYARAQTARGHLEARAESVGRPMRYDLGVIDQHLNQVIHDLSWHEYLIDANRLLGSDPIDSAVREHYGPEVLKVMKKTLEDVAIGDLAAQNVIERGVRYIRSGVSIALMGWNLATAALQPLGLTQSMVRIGPKWVAKGMSRWLRDASSMESTVGWVTQKSEFMRLRAKTMQREISEIRNTIGKGETMSAVEGSFFYLIGKLQLVADIPTWIGMYEKSMAANPDEARAIALADQAVLDSQGGGQIKDLAAVQRGGEWQKLWTNFYSYFNVTYNQIAESIGETQKVGASRLPLLAADVLMLTVVPATLGFFLKAALKGTLGDDDEDKLLKKLAAENVSYLMGTMIGLRELNAAVSGSMGYEGPAGARFFADVAKLGKQIGQGDADEAFWRAANELGGVLLHYPALQIDRTVRGLIELSEKDSPNPLAPLFGPKPKN